MLVRMADDNRLHCRRDRPVHDEQERHLASAGRFLPRIKTKEVFSVMESTFFVAYHLLYQT